MVFNESQQRGKDEKLFVKSKLFSLMIQCPIGEDKSQKCPFKCFRASSNLEENYTFIESMKEEDRHQLLAIHQRCFELKTGNFIHLNHACSQKVGNGSNVM